MRRLSVLAFVVAASGVAVFSCSGSSPKGGFDEDGGSSGGGGDDNGFSTDDDAGDLAFSEGGASVSLSGDCKAGHYTGTFDGLYSSYLTFVGIPIPVVGDVQLDLQQDQNGGGGEFPTFTIANGTISGTADGAFPYFCRMIGTLDCGTKKLVGGGLRDCTYCLGVAFGDLADGGTCVGGHFEGPLDALYDAKTSSFVSGTWNGSEKAAADDGGLPEGGSINDAGLYAGPGNYGGKGTWKASLGGTASARDK